VSRVLSLSAEQAAEEPEQAAEEPGRVVEEPGRVVEEPGRAAGPVVAAGQEAVEPRQGKQAW
jgi:hypothetical protein